MKITQTKSWYKALILDKKRLNELNQILSEYFDKIKYSITCYNESEIEFTSLDELLSHDNFGEFRIKELNIRGYSSNSDDFTSIRIKKSISKGNIIGYFRTAIIYYTLTSKNNMIVYDEKISRLLKKSTARYWLLGKFTFYGMFCIPSLIMTIINIMIGNTQSLHSLNYINLLIIILIVVAIFVVIFILDTFLKKVFPPVAFLWGEEIENYNKWVSTKSNIFWGIFIAIAVGIVCTYITNSFM